MNTRRRSDEQIDLIKNDHKVKHKNNEILRKKLQNKAVHKMLKI